MSEIKGSDPSKGAPRQSVDAEIDSSQLLSENLADQGKRVSKLTEKGHDYKIDELKRRFSRFLAGVKSTKLSVTKLSVTSKDSDEIRNASSAMFASLSSLSDCYKELEKILGRDPLFELAQFLAQAEEDVAKAAESAQAAIQCLSFELSKSDASSSRHSKSRTGSISSKSAVTTSSKFSYRQNQIEKLQKVASLKAQLPFLEERNKLDAKAKRLSVEMEIAGLEAGIQASREAEVEFTDLEETLSLLPIESQKDRQQRILSSIENKPASPTNDEETSILPADTKPRYDTVAKSFITPSQPPKPYHPVPRVEENCVSPAITLSDVVEPNSTHAQFEQGDSTILATVAKVVSETMSAPKLECLKFSGDPLFYTSFIQCFRENIDKRQFSPTQKLGFLLQSTEGKARQAIDHCSNVMPQDKGYKLALDTLFKRYGRPQVIVSAFKSKLFKYSTVRSNDRDALYDYASCLRKCLETLQSTGNAAELNSSLSLLSEKLPPRVYDAWNRRYAKISFRDQRSPDFQDLVKFVEEEANLLNAYPEQIPSSRIGDDKRRGTKPNFRKTTCANTAAKEVPQLKCYYCEQRHVITKCEAFQSLTLKERREFLNNKTRCFNCFNKHATKECRKAHSCTVSGCKGRHHSLMHNFNLPKSDNTAPQGHQRSPGSSPQGESSGNANSHSVSCNTSSGSERGYFNIVPVKIRAKEKEICCYAFLDLGSDTTFCNKKLVQALGLVGESKRISLSTLGHRENIHSCKSVRFSVSSLDGTAEFDMKDVVTMDKLPISPNRVLTERDVLALPYLQGLHFPALDGATVDVLIGNDIIKAHKILEEREGNGSQPNAIRTPLGWSLIGPSVKPHPTRKASANFARMDKDLDQEIQNSWYKDFEPDDLKIPTSVEDRKVLKLLKENVSKTDGHFYAPLPWREEVTLPANSQVMAERRLVSTKRRLQKDEALKEKYVSQMQEYIQRGYAEEVSNDQQCNEKAWYLPHHPVLNPRKPGKVRIVFDCAAKHRGICLNDALMQGPDLVNSILSVLTRFRRERIALAADVESMFHQVRIKEEDRDSFRFVWWPNGNLSSPPTVHRMLVHIFGATSSPCCATYCLRQSADWYGSNFDPDISKVVNRDFYVDDCLTSTCTIESAITLVEGLRKLLALGGFRLTKWISSSADVLNSIPPEERAKSVTNVDLEESVKERVLGVQWNVSNDEFGFKVSDDLERKSFTRRSVLSTVNSLYDPLGFIAPVILVARKLQQRIIEQELDWDEELPTEDVQAWNKWLAELLGLSALSLPRCFKPLGLKAVINYQIHHFCDASLRGYGFVSYLRLVDENGVIHCSFLCGKAKVTPPRSESIPRLELVAAVLAVKADHWIRTQLEYSDCQSIFWTDSSAVRSSINNKTKRFRTFVANRLAKIHRQTEPSQWRHVGSRHNPADHASRGLTVSQLLKSNWLTGPAFLWQTEDEWPKAPEAKTLPSDALPLDFQPVLAMHAASVESGGLTTLNEFISRYSSWTRLKIAAAWLRRFINYVRDKSSISNTRMTVDEIQAAERKLISFTQHHAFSPAYKMLSKPDFSQRMIRKERNRELKSLAKLDPYLDDNDALRVGGRLENAPVQSDSKHPIILPSHHHVTTLIIRHHHLAVGHSGLSHTWNAIRKKYWIIKGGAAVKKELNRCMLCRMRNAPRCHQQMSILPAARLKPNEPPFSYVGIDYFGPFLTKRGRTLEKRYGCVYSCLTMRAVHIEMAYDMTSDSFINCFRRFMGRRGKPKQIFSDNGSNFIGAERILRTALQELNHSQLESYFLQNEITWNFNPPTASHMGGAWERTIRSIRRIFTAICRNQTLTDDLLQTLFIEVEKILNSRPLFPIMLDPTANEPLTPNHLLLAHSEDNLPPGLFNAKDEYTKRRWRQVQHLTNMFWKRWLREYLPTIALRSKWPDRVRNLKSGDIVLVVDETVPRGKWRMGRVSKTFPDHRGNVRVVEVKTQSGVIRRPIAKLCLIGESDHPQQRR